MAVSVGLAAKARTIEGVEVWPYRAVADAMEVIPRTLVQNAGGNAIRVLTELRVSVVHQKPRGSDSPLGLRLNMQMASRHGASTAKRAR